MPRRQEDAVGTAQHTVRRRMSPGWCLGTAASQIALAALIVGAPKVVIILLGVGLVVVTLMWALGGTPPELRTPGPDSAEVGRAGRSAHAVLPTVWAAALVTLALFILDVTGLFTHSDSGVSPLRYLLLPIPFGVFALGVRRTTVDRRVRVSDVLILVLLAWGLTASLAYKLLSNGDISGLSIFLPMLLVLLPMFPRGGDVSEATALRMLDLVTYLGLAYVLVHLGAGLGFPGISRGAHGHQEAFLLAMAAAAAFATGRRKVALLELAAIAGIYLLYPAATYVTTTGAVLVTVLLASRSRSGFRTLVIALAVPTVLVLGFSSSLSSSEDSVSNTILSRYFDAIGKNDNSAFRKEMLKAGFAQVRTSPVIGANFTGGFALPTKFRVGREAVLPHNDYLELTLAGGLIALGLFVGWAAGTNILVIRRHRVLVETGMRRQAAMLWTSLIGFNACLSVGLFQPVLFELGTVTLFFLIYGCMRLMVGGNDQDVAPINASDPGPPGGAVRPSGQR